VPPLYPTRPAPAISDPVTLPFSPFPLFPSPPSARPIVCPWHTL
jgi:hypothetical protein